MADDRDASGIAAAMGEELGLYPHLVPQACGGAASDWPDDPTRVDVRSLVLIREALGFAHPQADAIFAVQGLGSYPIAVQGNAEQRARWLPDVVTGRRIAAFALTEPEAGSDVASLRCEALPDGDGFRLRGEKTLISNVPIADHYVVFANADPEKGRKGISAFVVQAEAPGLEVEPLGMSIDHPVGSLLLDDCPVGRDSLLGEVGDGFKLAMRTLDTFRISVGAAANGMATAALEDTLDHVTTRRQFGAPLAAQQIVQAYLAEMATELDAGRLMVARAAYAKDRLEGRHSAEVAMAKLVATEGAQRIIDKAVQLHGGRGVLSGTRVEALYRDIRPLRIYEGTTEIQKLIISRALLDAR
ncbi:MAG: acyl-CoA dehydrogenase family protein [Myxococcales bacterium]|nr:acyl-CoA dehydrogenase family protein [Myxococcales bacterium]